MSNLKTILDAIDAVLNSEKASAIALSKGGWEGWLQCELWYELSIEQTTEVEREVTPHFSQIERKSQFKGEK